MRPARIVGTLAAVLLVGLYGTSAQAAQVHVAVAANFTEAAKEIAEAFKKKSGDEAVLSFGSSGQLYTQITQNAPFEIMLSADTERPKKLVADGLGVSDSVFTYAVGKLVLWSKSPNLVKGDATLKSASFSKIAIANPTAAPYGAAAGPGHGRSSSWTHVRASRNWTSVAATVNRRKTTAKAEA